MRPARDEVSQQLRNNQAASFCKSTAIGAMMELQTSLGEMTEEEKQKAVEEAAQAQPGEEIIEECKEVDVIGILKSIKMLG